MALCGIVFNVRIKVSQTKGKTLKKTIKNKALGAVALAAACGLSMSALCLTGCSNDKADNTNATVNEATNEVVENTNEILVDDGEGIVTTIEEGDEYASGIHHVTLNVDGYEPITIELNADAAPITVSNFMHLAEDGYYDGLAFYRFQDGFCMQGGTAGNTATSTDTSIPVILGEFSANGQNNPLADDFKRGTVAMARTGDPDSASSTFFVTLDSGTTIAKSLNGMYAAFGTIDENGMKVVDKIVADRAKVSKDGMGMVANDDDLAYITTIDIVD